MARKSYSEEFRRQAVELYQFTPGATLRGIAADLGITRNTLKDWVTTLWVPEIARVAADLVLRGCGWRGMLRRWR